MKNTIEELIRFHSIVLGWMERKKDGSFCKIHMPIINDTIMALKNYKKWLGNSSGENYIVSMSPKEFKEYEKFKEFQEFQQKLKKTTGELNTWKHENERAEK